MSAMVAISSLPCRPCPPARLPRLHPTRARLAALRAESGGRVAGPRGRGRGPNPTEWSKESRRARWRRRAAATVLALLVLLGAVGGAVSSGRAKVLQNRLQSGQIEYVTRLCLCFLLATKTIWVMLWLSLCQVTNYKFQDFWSFSKVSFSELSGIRAMQVYNSDTAFRQAERVLRSRGVTILNHRLSSPREVPSPWAAKSWVADAWSQQHPKVLVMLIPKTDVQKTSPQQLPVGWKPYRNW